MRNYKILIVSPTSFIPIDSGFKEVVYQVYSELRRRGHKVIIISHTSKPILKIDRIASKARMISKLLDLINWNIVRMNFNPFFLLKLIKTIKNQKIDILQIEGFWAAPLACIAAKITSTPCIIHDHNVPTYPTNQYTKPMAVLGAIFVNIGMYLADLITVTSAEEKEFLLTKGFPEGKIKVLPHGVNLEKINKMIKKSKEKLGLGDGYNVLFVGDYSWHSNVIAVERIATEIAPRVEKEIPNVRFVIIGKNPPIHYSRPTIFFTGWVEDIVPYIKLSDVGIAPLEVGGGISIKVMEYMVGELPVVSTSFGLRGIKVKHNKHVLIADDYDTFSRYIIELLKNKEKRIKIGKNGRRLIEEKYSWKFIIDVLEDEISNLVR
jgi:glycosyltransferase involved in cell wall biosynthesis